ncbi:winged helix-turn-helix transcriptional regulator [Candidatus Bathyarchaeota archaeon]|nr:winged helix-turn-helix transcriptional regulator [Candidatus Bathyarchaeota archaeon]
MRPTDQRAVDPFEPEAFLRSMRNVRPGLRTRSKIVKILRIGNYTAMQIASLGGMSYRSALNHLKALEKEKIAMKTGSRPSKWSLTGAGQQSVTKFLGKD